MLPNVGAQELLIIFFIALIVVGPRRLPEIGRALGRGLNEFKKLQDEVRDMVKFDLNEEPPDSTPRMEAPPEPEALEGFQDDTAAPSDAPEVPHSQRVVELAAAEEESQNGHEPSPWIYDTMDDDEPDVKHPPVGSTE